MWALSVSFELEPYYDQLDHINHTLWEAKHNIFYKIDLKRREINGPHDLWRGSDNNTIEQRLFENLGNLRHTLDLQISVVEIQTANSIIRLKSLLNSITRLYTREPISRSKRSLLPWGGDLLNALFGTATESDLDGLRKQISNLAVNQNDLVHVVENSLSMLNKINTLASQNRHAMNKLVIDLGKLNNNLHKIRSLVLTLQLLNIFSRNVISGVNTITLSIAQTLENLNIEINQFASNLDKAMRGQLSTTLIRPAELRSILNDISHRLPNSLKLNEFERQKIMWYYKMLPVTVIPDNNKIHIITVIPLIPLESLFTLYRVVVVPIPILGTNRNSEVIIEGTHFAVSDRGNNFVILDEDELSKCTNSDMSYCPLHRAEMNLARILAIVFR